MNDIIKYSNLLVQQGLDSAEAANILAAHDGDEIFAQRARTVRQAYEARQAGRETRATAKQMRAEQFRRHRILAWALIVIGSILIGFAAFKITQPLMYTAQAKP